MSTILKEHNQPDPELSFSAVVSDCVWIAVSLKAKKTLRF